MLKSTIVLSALLLAHIGYAEGETKTSEENRHNKKYDIVAEPIGFSVFPLPSIGVTGGMYLKPDMVVELSHAEGRFSLFFFELFSKTTSLRLKKYWGNSFYTNSGLAIRKLGGRFSTDDLKDSSGSVLVDFPGGEVSATSLAADLSLGNKWQFENFTIGCDWIGFLIPVAKLSTRDDFPPTSEVSEGTSDNKKSMEKLAVNGSLQALRFYLGASF